MIDTVIHGNSLDVLKTLPDNSVDSIVTDPPAGIAFMSKEWDTFSPEYLKKNAEYRKNRSMPPSYHRGQGKVVERKTSAFSGSSNYAGSYDWSLKGRAAFIKFMTDIMTEALRVLRPGGHALVWALPRTSHWTATALEDAGFEVREKLYHLFGSGFPKSMDVSKAIDKMAGAEREVIGTKSNNVPHYRNSQKGANGRTNDGRDADNWDEYASRETMNITAPATPEAQQWQGWGTATKPAVEEWVLCRKPLSEASIAANVLHWNCGALNIDACRVGNETRINRGMSSLGVMHDDNWQPKEVEHVASGRWPSHLLLSHSLWCQPQGVKRVRSQSGGPLPSAGTPQSHTNSSWKLPVHVEKTRYDADGYEQVEAWLCTDDCPIAELDRQSGVRKSDYVRPKKMTAKGGMFGGLGKFKDEDALPGAEGYPGETGGASRYFTNFPPADFVPWLYQSKASRAERNQGCEGLPEVERKPYEGGMSSLSDKRMSHEQNRLPAANHHPTVKSLALMRWLIRLITPPGGVVLDMFGGSGSTAVAAIQENVHFILVEQDASYVAIAEARIAHAQREVGVTQAQEYDCAEDCPIRIIGEQSGVSKSKRGTMPPSYGATKGVHEGWRRPAHEHYHTKEGGYDDQGTAARYFQQFPPDSLFAELEEVAV